MSMFAAIFFFLLLVVMAMMDGSMGLPLAHPLHAAVDAINESGPFVGVVMAYPTEEEALRSSGEFVPGRGRPSVDLYGMSRWLFTIKFLYISIRISPLNIYNICPVLTVLFLLGIIELILYQVS